MDVNVYNVSFFSSKWFEHVWNKEWYHWNDNAHWSREVKYYYKKLLPNNFTLYIINRIIAINCRVYLAGRNSTHTYSPCHSISITVRVLEFVPTKFLFWSRKYFSFKTQIMTCIKTLLNFLFCFLHAYLDKIYMWTIFFQTRNNCKV